MLVYISSTKKYQFSPFYNLMLVLGKIQDASRANTHKVLYNPSCREDQRLSTEGIKSFRNTATYQKLEGGSITPPTPARPPPHPSLVLR